MAYSEKFTCDICGTERTETNHWFLARGAKRLASTQDSRTLVILCFTVEDARESDIKQKMLCGESCVAKWVSENLVTVHPQLTQVTKEDKCLNDF